MELAILPFFIPLILIGRFVDAWREYRGTNIDGARTLENGWAQTWGQFLSTSKTPLPATHSNPRGDASNGSATALGDVSERE